MLREVMVRRYQCQQCRLVMTVTTEALLPRKHYGAATIGLALWLWSVTRWPAAKVPSNHGTTDPSPQPKRERRRRSARQLHRPRG